MKKTAFFLTFSFLISIVFAQQAQWQHIVSDAGVKALAETEEYLWLGNNGGLFRINKQNQQCTWYNSINSTLPCNSVNDILIDKSGSVWVATGYSSTDHGGLVKITGNSWQVFTSANSLLPANVVYCLAEDNNGLLWIGTHSGGIATFDGNNWQTYNKPEVDIPSGIISDLTFDSNGKLWIADVFGPASFDGTNWVNISKQFPTISSLNGVDIAPDGKVWFSTGLMGLVALSATTYSSYSVGGSDFTCVLVDDETGTVWGGNYDGGLAKINGDNITHYTPENSSLPGNCVTHLSFSPSGELYIGNENNLVLWDMDSNWQSVEVADMSLPSNYITAIEYNPIKNETWMATNNGLAMFNGIEWKVYNASNSGLPENFITDIELDTAGNIWATTQIKGLVKYDGVNWTVYNSSNSPLQFNVLSCLKFDNTGVLWIGTDYFGLLRFDITSSTRYSTNNSNLTNNDINKIGCSPEGDIYLAVPGKLLKFTGNNFNVILSGEDIRDMYWDDAGNLCVLSLSRGLKVLHNNTWTVYNMVDYGMSENANYLTCCAKGPGGNVWFGTSSAGMVKYDGNNFFNYTHLQAPLTSDQIIAISVDKMNNKWLATRNGITLFNENGILLNSQPVTLSGLSESLFIYPNPATDKLRLVSPNGDKLNSCRVINLSGETVLNQPIFKSNQINITDLKPGVFIIIATGNNGIYTRKFVKL